jgi:dipeptidase
MCDTLVAVGHASADGVTLFGKNSDREPNEAQPLERLPRQRHAPGSSVQCTYLAIPQVEETNEVLISRPAWMWGAEIGANEHGVAIGNEAVFAKIPYEKEPALTGMDLLRLALERASTAREALEVITTLLEAYGQGGNCGYTHRFEYYNSYIIADPREAWVLETAGRQWAAEHVTDGIRTISNRLTIGSEWDLASDDLVKYAVEHRWCKGRDDFHFARCYSDRFYSTFSFARPRQTCTTRFLSGRKGRLTLRDILAALRDHAPGASGEETFSPAFGVTRSFVCQHAGFGPLRDYQSTASLAAHLAPDRQTYFATGTSAPCTSIYKPVWLGAALPDTGLTPGAEYNEAALWWRHEVLHRETLVNYPMRHALYAQDRDRLEQSFIDIALANQRGSIAENTSFMIEAFAQAAQAEEKWLTRIRDAETPPQMGSFYRQTWRRLNRQAGVPVSL